jgi:thiosulfate/3-mercaptopyruvate sulfurtransferase
MKNSLTRYALGLGLSLGASAWALAAQPLLNPEQLQPLLQQADVRLIDIRDPKAFEAGHIAQAANAPYGKWRGPATNPGELPDQAKLVALVQSLGLTPATHAIVISSGADATDFGAAARVLDAQKPGPQGAVHRQRRHEGLGKRRQAPGQDPDADCAQQLRPDF